MCPTVKILVFQFWLKAKSYNWNIQSFRVIFICKTVQKFRTCSGLYFVSQQCEWIVKLLYLSYHVCNSASIVCQLYSCDSIEYLASGLRLNLDISRIRHYCLPCGNAGILSSLFVCLSFGTYLQKCWTDLAGICTGRRSVPDTALHFAGDTPSQWFLNARHNRGEGHNFSLSESHLATIISKMVSREGLKISVTGSFQKYKNRDSCPPEMPP